MFVVGRPKTIYPLDLHLPVSYSFRYEFVTITQKGARRRWRRIVNVNRTLGAIFV